jgi:acetyltransferase-like isoleucine patch superfamily enzyme
VPQDSLALGMVRFISYMKNILITGILTTERFLKNKKEGLLARLRVLYWRYHFANRPQQFTVYGRILIRRPENVTIGEHVDLNEGLYINARDKVTIGHHCSLSAYVRIITGGLNLEDLPEDRGPHIASPVVIGNYVWLATGVTVTAGVTIHDGVVVGAGSIVTKDLPPYTLCVGVPAKPIRELPRPHN